jgi:hypothetical protein
VNFQSQSQLLKLQYVTKILLNHNSAWVTIAQSHIHEALRHGKYRQQVKFWTCQEYLLLQPTVHLKSAALRSIMKGWKLVFPSLKLELATTHLPSSMTLLQMYYLLLQGQPFDPDEYRALKLYAQTRGVYTVQDLLQDNSWQLSQEFADQVRSSRFVGLETFERLVSFASDSVGTESCCISTLKGWQWQATTHSFKGWELSLKQWRSLQPAPQEVIEQHNRRWGCRWNHQGWLSFWKMVWLGFGHNRTKFIVWRLLHHGFYTNSRGALWKVCEETCPVCLGNAESTFHMFFLCPEVKQRWSTLLTLLSTTSMDFGPIHTPLDLLLAGVLTHRQTPTRLIVIAEVIWTTWLERNDHVYRGQLNRTPLLVILRRVSLKVEALGETALAEHPVNRLRTDMEGLERLQNTLSNRATVAEIIRESQDSIQDLGLCVVFPSSSLLPA